MLGPPAGLPPLLKPRSPADVAGGFRNLRSGFVAVAFSLSVGARVRHSPLCCVLAFGTSSYDMTTRWRLHRKPDSDRSL